MSSVKKEDLEVVKRLLILLLLYEGATIRDITKVTGMSSATLYKFLPKDIAKKRKQPLNDEEEEK